jgi:hypothetical protein
MWDLQRKIRGVAAYYDELIKAGDYITQKSMPMSQLSSQGAAAAAALDMFVHLEESSGWQTIQKWEREFRRNDMARPRPQQQDPARLLDVTEVPLRAEWD